MPILHYEQRHADSCIPACMCVVQLWRGEAATEDLFHQGAAGEGHDIQLVKSLPRVRTQTIGYGDEEEINLALRLGHLVLAILAGPPYVAWFTARYPQALSRHGRLCVAGLPGPPRHAIVLMGQLDDGYHYHDPWYPADGQPYEMSEDDFQSCFCGSIAVAEP